MKIKIIIKLFALAFCILGSIFLNLDNVSWIHDVLSIGLCAYLIILVVCLIALALHSQLDYTLDYLFMLIGAILNFTGGIMAIIYYCDKYERYNFNIPSKNLLPIGICSVLAGICMLADLIKGIFGKLAPLTGFGPFGEHKINASWEAVSLLPDTIDGFNIIKQQIPVLYKHVEENVPLLWKQYKPKLVIHVGVSSISNEIQLEACANRTGYQRKDIGNDCPENGQACCGQLDIANNIKTGLCTETICEKLKSQNLQLQISVSNDPGRFLCEFIYYISLSQNNDRTLFVHVPPLDKPYSRTQLAEILEQIIKCALELINENENVTLSMVDSPRIYKNGRAAAAF